MGWGEWGGQRERGREEKGQGFNVSFKGILSVTYFLQLGSISQRL